MSQGEGGGRPPIVLSDEQVAEIQVLAKVLSKTQIASYLGIDDNTFRAIEDRQPEVFQAYKKGQADAVLRVANNLIMQSDQGNASSTIFFLKTRGGEMWKEQNQVEHNHQPISIEIVNPYDDDSED